MRLSRLDLTRYGRFTDARIDFGAAEPGRPDLHLIYGPNEAGKSTTFAAWLDLLFGIEPRTAYGFLHPYATMQVGARLEVEGEARELARVKRTQNSLLDPHGRPLAEHAALALPGGMDREAYRTMFSLDEHSLEAGGESILASKGDLGQLLFAASAGLSELSQALDGLREEADAFYRYRARSGALAELKARLAELRDERRAIDTQATEFAALVESRDASRARYEQAAAERAQARMAVDRARRILGTMPRLVELRQAREALAPLETLPDAPAEWLADTVRLGAERIELAARRDALVAEIAALERETGEVAADGGALELAGRFEEMGALHAFHVSAEKDLPSRRQRLVEIEALIGGIAAALAADAADPASLLIDAATIGTIRGLMQRRSGIEAALASARDELAEAERRRDAAIAEAGRSGAAVDAAAVIAIGAALAAVRAGDHALRLRQADRELARHSEFVAERMRALLPWSGDPGSLSGMEVPHPTEMEAWERRLDQGELALARETAQEERLAAEQRRLTIALDALGATTRLVTDAEAAARRAERDGAWAAHRQALDAATAETFEAAMRRDDVAAGARLANASAVERLNQAAEALAIVEAQLDDARAARQAADAALVALHGEVAAAVVRASPLLPAEMGLLRFAEWLERRGLALEAARLARQSARERAEAEADGRQLRNRLAAALADAGVAHEADASAERLAALAQATLDRAEDAARLRRQVEECEAEVEARARALAGAGDADARWSEAWAAACAGTWLAGKGSLPDVAAADEILSRLSALEPLLRERDQLADRIGKMERDQAGFAAAVSDLAAELALPEGGPPLAGYRAIEAAIEAARAAAARAAAARKRLEEARARLRAIGEAIAVSDRQAARLTAHFSVETLDAVAERLRLLATRPALRARVAALGAEIAEAMGTAAPAEAEALIEACDRAALERQLAQDEPLADALDQQLRELFSAQARAEEKLEAVGGDGTVARIEQARATVLAEIEERAAAWFRLRAGALAAETALRAYRDRHRSAMMRRASDAFSTISRGAYSGLATQPAREGEVLVALAADGTSKLAADLSRGTRFQLYLALRVAGYLEFAAVRRPVPFVADDIMETFDDFRAEEAFRLFATMAEAGQVIYLTHHRHLIDIARRVLPGVRVHELPNQRPDVSDSNTR